MIQHCKNSAATFLYMLKSRNDRSLCGIPWELYSGSFNQNLYGTVGNINIRNIRLDLTPFLPEFLTLHFLLHAYQHSADV